MILYSAKDILRYEKTVVLTDENARALIEFWTGEGTKGAEGCLIAVFDTKIGDFKVVADCPPYHGKSLDDLQKEVQNG